jgi:hypothetical protein
VRSTSFISALPHEAWLKIEQEIRALIASEPALASRDVVTVPYDTIAYSTVKV